MRRGIYADATTCEPRRRAALHGGALACVSAARHRGMWVLAEDDALHISLIPDGHGHPVEGSDVVTHWDHVAGDRFGLPSVFVILPQILTCRGVEEFFVALESALHRRALCSSDLPRLAARLPRTAGAAIASARTDAESGLESLLRWRLRRHGLPIRTQVPVFSVGRVDLIIGESLIVEVDGAENHDGPSHRHRDLMRDATAATWGFVTLRFDYAMVVHDWPVVEAAILAHVSRGLHRR
ncbi:MAG: DUF559 domain-containing protein [Actinobacteria bacterium]|nr:DUF559 domain-containing protein [Actinomycetota bacterium]